MRRTLPVIRPVVLLQLRTAPETARTCLEAMPAQLDRVDALLAEGVIGGERPNAADFQVAPSVRLMLTFDQLREHIDARPAGRHARALVPDYPGRFREVFPAQWLPF
jgi:glutathione S-transferase